MKKIILVIFFFAIIMTIIIYNLFSNKKENILIISESNYINYIDDFNDYNIKIYKFDNITYKEMINVIKSNDYIKIKNKKIYLNQLIASSDYIIFNINNNEYERNCKKKYSLYYSNRLNNYKKELNKILNKMSNSKILYLNNNCETPKNDSIYKLKKYLNSLDFMKKYMYNTQ